MEAKDLLDALQSAGVLVLHTCECKRRVCFSFLLPDGAHRVFGHRAFAAGEQFTSVGDMIDELWQSKDLLDIDDQKARGSTPTFMRKSNCDHAL